jgi:exopolysaccharide transport family protein
MDENREEQQIDLRDYLRVLIKRRWTIIAVFAIILITVSIQTFTATPIFQATTRLVIEKENPKVVSIQEVMAIDASGTEYYQTQHKIIESRVVAREVIKRLRLDENEEFVPKGKEGVISRIKRSIRGGISSFKNLLRSPPRDARAPMQESDAGPEDSGLVSDFISRISVSPVGNSRLVDVGFKAKDKALAAKVVNTLANAYIDKNLETKLRAAQDAVRWLNDRIEEERKKVEKAEQALLRYKERHNIITDFSSDIEKVTAQKLAQLNQQVVDAESKRVEAETKYKQAAALSNTPDMMDSIPEVLNNSMIQQIKAMEVELYKKTSELSKKYGERHPQMVAIESELGTLQSRKKLEIQRVINSLKNQYQVALARENSLKAALEKQKNESLDLNQKAIEYGVLQREAESARQMYDLLIKRFKETSLTEDMQTGNIRIIDRAEVPTVPIKPKKRQNILLAIVVGLMAGVGLAFFFEYLDNTVKLPEDIKRHLKAPYLGPVPMFAMNGAGVQTTERLPDLVTVHAPKSTASEAYRGIRTNILFSSAEHAPQVILVSSAGPLEGKSVTSANLAVTMAQSGAGTLLVDCDLRKPTVHKIFRVPRDKGLSNLLVGACGFDEALTKTSVPNLEVIPCGSIPPNPSELLGSSRMAKLLEALRKKYSKVIIDSPPLTAVADAVVLAKMADGVIVVVRAADTPKEIVKNGLAQLHSVNAKVLGVVLNGVNMGREGYYYYQYYYYYYGEDGKDSRVTKRKKRTEGGDGKAVNA